MQADHIIAAIIGGALDADLEKIQHTIRDRVRELNYRKIHSLNPGDKVRICRTRPQYLNGLPATVVRVMNTYVEVNLDEPMRYGHKLWHRGIRTPMSCLEPVQKPTEA
jgi:hypothetical protein